MESSAILTRRYHLEKELGRGGFCVTWLAHPKKRREPLLVVKELQLEKLGDWQSLDQFEREAQLLSHLDHANIPDFVDFISEDTSEGRRLYLVQECIEGKDLASLPKLAERARAALELPLDRLLATTRAVIDEAGVRVIERWFSAPVSPVVLRPTEVETS